MRRRNAFTLVELLVVIGIIAVLVGILLPVLGGVRKQAAAVKCATQLREIGNAFQLYSLENKGWYPPSQLQTAAGFYNIDGINYPANGFGAYWFNFLSKYATKSKMGYSTLSAGDRAEARKTIFWGCAAWEGYVSPTNAGGLFPAQIGYGMTWWPTFTPTVPAGTSAATAFPPASQRTFIEDWKAVGWQMQLGNFFKQKVYARNGAQRALIADSRFWAYESQRGPANGVLPNQSSVQNNVMYTTTSGNETTADIYRHGKYPPKTGNSFVGRGGKVAFNILYCDGHVSTSTDWREAYRAQRQRFPN